MSCTAPFTVEELLSPRSLARRAWDILGIPLRFVVFPDAWSKRFGWSSLEEERLRAVLPCIDGRLVSTYTTSAAAG